MFGDATGQNNCTALLAVQPSKPTHLSQADFQSLFEKEMAKVSTEAQQGLINEQIVDSSATVTNANVKLLQTWYDDATKSNKVFANKLIIASLSTPAKTAAKTSTDTATTKCPVSTYAGFGSLYSRETAGKTWARIEQIDSWVRGAPGVGAPLSVRKLHDCYKHVLTTAQQKHFTDDAVKHMMEAGKAR